MGPPATPPASRSDPRPRAARETAAPVLPAVLERISSTIDWLSCAWKERRGASGALKRSRLFITWSQEMESSGLFVPWAWGQKREMKVGGMKTQLSLKKKVGSGQRLFYFIKTMISPHSGIQCVFCTHLQQEIITWLCINFHVVLISKRDD